MIKTAIVSQAQSAASFRSRLTGVFQTALLLAFVLIPQTALTSEVTVMLPGNVPMTLVKIPAGQFLMGSPEEERGNVFDNEHQHQVLLTKDYYLGKTEVTQQQWAAVMGQPMSTDCGTVAVGDQFPVYCVTWDKIAGPGGFIEKLNQHLATTEFRLPTEAEWERAARAGTTSRYWWGDALECSDECEPCAAHEPNMWWCGNAIPFAPQMVATKLPNPFGLHDMLGNLWEIVNDRYQDQITEPATDPTGPSHNGDVVMRGGGREAWLNRSASRLGTAHGEQGQNDEVGFRIAASSLEGFAFQINSGLNDVWFNPATNGQGFLIAVFPDIQQFFMAWFTFDSERPADGVSAILGEPGHRWLTALGPYSGDTASLTISLTQGGVFDAADPPAVIDPEPYGTMTFEFAGCNEGLVTYSIPSLNLTGEIPIQRIVLDNVALCETLNGQ